MNTDTDHWDALRDDLLARIESNQRKMLWINLTTLIG